MSDLWTCAMCCALVAESLLPGEYDTAGLPAGTHEYQIVGVNSRGEGPVSLSSTVEVEAEAEAAA